MAADDKKNVGMNGHAGGKKEGELEGMMEVENVDDKKEKCDEGTKDDLLFTSGKNEEVLDGKGEGGVFTCMECSTGVTYISYTNALVSACLIYNFC